MQGYAGFLTDVVTLAHESAYAVHYRLLYKAGVPWFYSDRARYFTEEFAKVNELLILDELAKFSKSQADQLFYLREWCSKLASVNFASMYWTAYATTFETEVYRRIQSGTVKSSDAIHEVWAEFGTLWTRDFDKLRDNKYSWAGTHHFFDASRYYSNYLFAWVLAASVYEHLQQDPAFAGKVVKLMEAGFSEDPAVMLRTYLGIDLGDSKSLERVFSLVEERLAEFERHVYSRP
jgi:oligoendopeptidase F